MYLSDLCPLDHPADYLHTYLTCMCVEGEGMFGILFSTCRTRSIALFFNQYIMEHFENENEKKIIKIADCIHNQYPQFLKRIILSASQQIDKGYQ